MAGPEGVGAAPAVGYFRAFAADYDGTLSYEGQPPAPETLDALRRFRSRGGLAVLVTGRILRELRHVFPDVRTHFDAIVAENGCVLWEHTGLTRLAAPVSRDLLDDLSARGVRVRAGDVLLAGSANDRTEVLESVRELELDAQLVFNRSELMVLPSGVNKGTGVRDALNNLGVSRHSTIAVGDAENDRPLLDMCEAGFAAVGSVPSLAMFADHALTGEPNQAIVRLIDNLTHTEARPLHSARRQVRIGTATDGTPMTVPSSQANLLVCGEVGAGKSHLTGLFAERLIALGYSLIVIDPEGDHQGLGRLKSVVVIDNAAGLPAPENVAARFSQRFLSVVLDLSGMDTGACHDYLSRLALAVDRSRQLCGLPHWIISDEAHTYVEDLQPDSSLLGGSLLTGRWGLFLSTYQPDELDVTVLDQMDAIVTVSGGPKVPFKVRDSLQLVCGQPSTAIDAALRELPRGHAFLAQRPTNGPSGAFRVASRTTEHRRHWHKYTDSRLGPGRSFYFRDAGDRVVAVADNLRSLQEALVAVPEDCLEHHCRRHDLSRWLAKVFVDERLAQQIRVTEGLLADEAVDPETARRRLLGTLTTAYRL